MPIICVLGLPQAFPNLPDPSKFQAHFFRPEAFSFIDYLNRLGANLKIPPERSTVKSLPLGFSIFPFLYPRCRAPTCASLPIPSTTISFFGVLAGEGKGPRQKPGVGVVMAGSNKCYILGVSIHRGITMILASPP